jgi:hypothetical protein
LAGCCAFLGDVSVTAALSTTAAGEISAVIWGGTGKVMAAEIGAPVLQPATATIDTRKKDNVKVRA